MNSIDLDIEQYYKSIYKFVAGVDEAGRGALAGPVVASAVILPVGFSAATFGITDSKKVNEKKREELYDVIMENAVSVGVGFVHNEEIDKINILKSTLVAMHKAIAELNPTPDYLIIDGNYFNGTSIKYNTIVKGDLLCPSISAASIIAKVSRDRWMRTVAGQEFPEYGFESHKGYGVKSHYQTIEIYGKCKYHRITFLSKINKYTNNQLFA